MSDEAKWTLSPRPAMWDTGPTGHPCAWALWIWLHNHPYYEKNRESVRRIMRFDIFRMQWWLPASLLKIPYDIMNRRNRRRLHSQNQELTESITMGDYSIAPVCEECFDLFYIATK